MVFPSDRTDTCCCNREDQRTTTWSNDRFHHGCSTRRFIKDVSYRVFGRVTCERGTTSKPPPTQLFHEQEPTCLAFERLKGSVLRQWLPLRRCGPREACRIHRNASRGQRGIHCPLNSPHIEGLFATTSSWRLMNTSETPKSKSLNIVNIRAPSRQTLVAVLSKTKPHFPNIPFFAHVARRLPSTLTDDNIGKCGK